MKLEVVAIKNTKGEVELYDIYCDGVWFGSRSTISQIQHIYPEAEINEQS